MKNHILFSTKDNCYIHSCRHKETIPIHPIIQRIILDLQPTKREIYANQTINRNEFGKITVLPNGDILANPNNKKLGTIKDDRIHDIIYREMTEGNSWLRIRDQKPCCDCIYQWLCPSPSNYESVIGKPNLCHVKP